MGCDCTCVFRDRVKPFSHLEPSIMRTTLFLALSLTTLPALAADPKPEPPPSPSYQWIVEGYKAEGDQWVKQADHCLTTTDLKQAVKYEAEIMRFQDWIARSNIPALCSEVSDQFSYPPDMALPDQLERVGFAVWAFHLEGGKWVKAPKYCWTAPATYDSRIQALAYAKTVNAVEGWCATTNAPESTHPTVDQTVIYHGPLGTSGWTGGRYGRGGRYERSSNGGQILYRGRHMSIESGTSPDYSAQQWSDSMFYIDSQVNH
jgi:hypothetical protein